MSPERAVRASTARSSTLPHLVVKRGHNGRFRFAMFDEGERVGGEVYVDAQAEPPDVVYAIALAKIARLAEVLLVRVSARTALNRAQAGSGKKSRRSSLDGTAAHQTQPQAGGLRDEV